MLAESISMYERRTGLADRRRVLPGNDVRCSVRGCDGPAYFQVARRVKGLQVRTLLAYCPLHIEQAARFHGEPGPT